jgi:hypothetical protein
MLVTRESVPPLDASPLKGYSEPVSEKWLLWLPPIGWLWNHFRWQRWASPHRQAYEQILRGRPDIPIDVWGDTVHQGVAGRVLVIINDNFGWSNTRFVPWDPVCVAMWAYEDGLDDINAIAAIEQEFSMTFTDASWLEIYKGTLAELVDRLVHSTGVTA